MIKVMKWMRYLIVWAGALFPVMGGDLAPRNSFGQIVHNHLSTVLKQSDSSDGNTNFPEQDIKNLIKTLAFYASIIAPLATYHSDGNHWVASGVIAYNVITLLPYFLKTKRRPPASVVFVVGLWTKIPFYTTLFSTLYYVGQYTRFKRILSMSEEDLPEFLDQVYTLNMVAILFPPFHYFMKEIFDS